MKNIFLTFIIAVALIAGAQTLSFAHCGSCGVGGGDAHDHGKKSTCTMCEHGKGGEDLWCAGCNVGYIDSAKVKCEGCFIAKTEGGDCEACAV